MIWTEYGGYSSSRENYLEKVVEIDESRSSSHNSVIVSIDILNWLCEKNKIPLTFNASSYFVIL